MNKKRFIFLLMTFLIMVKPLQGIAQMDQADSVKYYFTQSRLKNGFDSSTFFKAVTILTNFKYSPEQLSKMDQTINSFILTENKDTIFLLKNKLADGLIEQDFYVAIDYSKKVFQEFKNYISPNRKEMMHLLLMNLRVPYRNSERIAEGVEFYNDAVQFFRARNDTFLVSVCYFVLDGLYYNIGLLEQSIYSGKKSLQYFNKYETSKEDLLFGIYFTNQIGYIVRTGGIADRLAQLGKTSESLEFLYDALKWSRQFAIKPFHVSVIYKDLINVYVLDNQFDSARKYVAIATPDSLEKNLADFSNIVTTRQAKARYFTELGMYSVADSIIRSCYAVIEKHNIQTFSLSGIIFPWYYHAIIKVKQKKYAEALAILEKGIPKVIYSRQASLLMLKLKAEVCSNLKLYDKAVQAYEAYNILTESIKKDQKKVGNLSFETEQKMADNAYAIERLQSENELNNLQLKFIIVVAVLMIAIALIAYVRYKQQKNLLQQLKSTQTQLVQSEKMASLGELTAGIAHEIQNPLNFVNNFSEVSEELTLELKEELNKGAIDEAKLISDDLIQNLQKIQHHGKRADAIVKGMLQHSRSSTGQKELTDINALCDEYLRLAYHGIRAKDSSFNVTLETHFDEKIGQVFIQPQEMGRVILNLINNALYAVGEKKHKGIEGFDPKVSITTKQKDASLEIFVEDNGMGIPEHVKEKIFQPFFTTKPTGQGTGLGLSLSYDIVKAHGGSLTVESHENSGTIFTIIIPK